MSVDIEKLEKILKSEAANNCQNRIVMGGLEGFIGNWVNKSRFSNPSSLEARLIERVSERLIDYGSYTQVGRIQAIREVLEAIVQVRQSNTPNLEKPPIKSLAQKSPQITEKAPTDISPKPRQTPDKSSTTLEKKPVATPNLDFNAPLINVKGVGEGSARLMELLGMTTVGKALYYFPFRHEDFSSFRKISELIVNQVESVLVQVVDKTVTRTRNGKEIVEVLVSDETGMLRCVFFNQKMVYQLKPGVRVVLSGRVERRENTICFKSPQFELADKQELLNTGRLVPVYSLTGNLKQPTIRRIIKNVVDQYAPSVPDHLPSDIKSRQQLPDLSASIQNYHYPADLEAREKARRRLAFDEFFLIQMGVLTKRREWQEERPAIAMRPDHDLLDSWYNSLPFALTDDQKKAIQSILTDLNKDKPMRRLVQGDVGSGKTVVAATALLETIANGYQGVLMAPTQILAEQHFKGLTALFNKFAESDAAKARGLTPRIALLSGAVKKKDKETTYVEISEGSVDIVIGTTAIIQEGVTFNKLGLAITDEQHRFGVIQRSTLRDKADVTNPHILTMTATPIPRSLSLTIYGDLDISVIKEKPPGRKDIKTKWVMPDERQRAYDFIRKQINAGHQAFIICPLVEESDNLEAKAAIEEHARLKREIFPEFELALLHGRMRPAEKDRIMLEFREKQQHILVATSVIEVGIDIPNATVILIEGADRFGLAQLHQFRGRVGRGEAQSTCLLLGSNDLTETGTQRLRIIEQSNDGFFLAEQDLKIRGPGEFFGTRQSGVPDLRVAGLGDTDLLELAREEANTLFQLDPNMSHYPLLMGKVAELWNTEGDLS